MKHHNPHYPSDHWAFDVAVADIFPSMARRSIPGYLSIQVLIEQIAEQLPAQSRVLDIGCATGETLQRLASLPLNLLGIELSPAMAQQAIRVAPTATIIRQDFLRAFGNNSEEFDLVCCLWTLQFMAPHERQQAWRLIARLLRPQGVLIVAEKTKQTEDQQSSYHQWKHKIGGYTWDEIRAKASSLIGVLQSKDKEEIEDEANRVGIKLDRIPSEGDLFGFHVWRGQRITALPQEVY